MRPWRTRTTTSRPCASWPCHAPYPAAVVVLCQCECLPPCIPAHATVPLAHTNHKITTLCIASTWYHHTAKSTHTHKHTHTLSRTQRKHLVPSYCQGNTHTHEHAHTTLSRTQRKHMDTHAPAHLQLEPPGLFLCLPLPHPAALRCLNLRCLRVSLRRCTQPGSDACNACGGPCQSLN